MAADCAGLQSAAGRDTKPVRFGLWFVMAWFPDHAIALTTDNEGVGRRSCASAASGSHLQSPRLATKRFSL